MPIMYLNLASTSFAVALLLAPNKVSAFTIGKSFILGQQQKHIATFTSSLNEDRTTKINLIALYAKGGTKKKAKKKKSSTSASSTGGFGKVAERSTSKNKKKADDDDDYAAFPRLDDKVQQTLIPSDPMFSNVAQDLPKEIYDRIILI